MEKKLFYFAKKSFYGTFLSRISGMFRDMSLAFFFGGSSTLAAFLVAYRFANLFRRLFGEGLLQMGFVPHYEKLRQEEKTKASYFFRDLLFSLIVTVSLSIFACEVFLGQISWEKEILFSLKIMLPGVLFLSLYALNSALLNCYDRFFLPSVTPAIFNIVWILFAGISYQFFSNSLLVLSLGVVIGFFFQWLLSLKAALVFLALPKKEFWKPKLFSKEVKELFPTVSLGFFAIGASQINSLLDGIFARMADPSGPAYLWYAIRLQQLPLGLFTIALTSALLPQLSKAVAAQNHEKFSSLFSFACRITLLFTLFCSFFLLALGGETVNFLLGRGAFSSYEVGKTLGCLWSYVAGLLFMALSLVFNTVYYAQKKVGYSSFFSCLSVGVNIFLNSLFVFGLHASSAWVALATSISAFLQAFLLYLNLEEKPRGLLAYTSKILGVGSISLLALQFIRSLTGKSLFLWEAFQKKTWVFPQSFFTQASELCQGTLLFVGLFLFFGWIANVKEIELVFPKRKKSFWEKG